MAVGGGGCSHEFYVSVGAVTPSLGHADGRSVGLWVKLLEI